MASWCHLDHQFAWRWYFYHILFASYYWHWHTCFDTACARFVIHLTANTPMKLKARQNDNAMTSLNAINTYKHVKKLWRRLIYKQKTLTRGSVNNKQHNLLNDSIQNVLVSFTHHQNERAHKNTDSLCIITRIVPDKSEEKTSIIL